MSGVSLLSRAGLREQGHPTCARRIAFGLRSGHICAMSKSLLAILALAPTAVAAMQVSGWVFDDANANGTRDASETGIAHVAVSDGVHVVTTDATGRYELPQRSGAQGVFVVKPSGYRLPTDARKLPQFYRWLADASTATIDFPLTKHDESKPVRVLLLADTQTDSIDDVGYLTKTISEPLAGKEGIDFGVTLGDVVNDHGELFHPVAESLARIGVTWHNVKGNHDLTLDYPEGAVGAFEKVHGPSNYAFHYSDNLFIALDNIRSLGGARYTGGLTQDQFTLVENLLRLTPPDVRVIVMTHIPWFLPGPASTPTFRMEDRQRLFSLLKDRPRVLLLTGHTHYQRHVFHGKADGWQGASPLHEYNVAAACGGFWGGPKDKDGIPAATCWDGTPAGYAVLTFEKERVKMDYRAARHEEDYQIGLHTPDAAHAGVSYVSFYANVFNGHDHWKVEWCVDERAFAPMRKVLDWDPSYAEAYLAQNRDPNPPPGRRLPDPVVCYHLWRASLPSDLPPGSHRVEVRATSPDGDVFSAAREVRVVGKR
jgi:hypothetical protein